MLMKMTNVMYNKNGAYQTNQITVFLLMLILLMSLLLLFHNNLTYIHAYYTQTTNLHLSISRFIHLNMWFFFFPPANMIDAIQTVRIYMIFSFYQWLSFANLSNVYFLRRLLPKMNRFTFPRQVFSFSLFMQMRQK